MSDLQSHRWIVAKGVLFLILALLSASMIFWESPTFRVAVLLAILAWASARFYYFLFYVLEQYVDPSLRYAGIIALLQTLMDRIRRRS